MKKCDSKMERCNSITSTNRYKILLVGIKVLGDIYVEFDDYENAKNLFSFYKIMSFKLELLEETMYSYEALGNVYKFLYRLDTWK